VIAHYNDVTCTTFTLRIDSIRMVLNDQIEIYYTIGLPLYDRTTNIGCVVARYPEMSPFDGFDPGDIQPAIGGGYTSFGTLLDAVPGKREAVTVFATDQFNLPEIAPWDNQTLITMGGSSSEVEVTETKKEIAMVNVFPNPSNGNFTIQNSLYGDMNYVIFNSQGTVITATKALGQKTNISLDVPTGIYFLMFAGGVMQKIEIVR
jgi:hypothetical protein